MTTHTTIPNAAVAAGGRPRGSLMTALRDNLYASFEGAFGAPRLQGKAVARVGDGLAVLSIAAAATHVLTVGTGFFLGISSTTSATDVVAATYTMPVYTGAARFNAAHSMNTGGTSTLSLFKNNVLVMAFTTTLTTLVARTIDVSFVPGDVFEWRHKNTSGNGSQVSAVSSLSVTGSDAYQNQLPVIKASEI